MRCDAITAPLTLRMLRRVGAGAAGGSAWRRRCVSWRSDARMKARDICGLSVTQSLSHSVTRSAASTRSSGSNEARRLELGDYPVPTDTLYCRYALPPYAYVFMRLVIASFHSPAILLASQQNRAGDERPWKTAPSVAMTMMMMMMMPLIAGDRFPRPSQHRLRGRGPGVVVE